MQTALVRQPNWTTTQSLPRGERGTVQTLKLMASFCKRDARSPELRAVAQKIIQGIPGHDFNSEIRALYYFTRDHITYRKDPVEVERVQDAVRTLQFRSGDCDDKVTLLVTLLAVCGHKARFCVSGKAPGQWQHVYCEVATPQGWLALDPTPESAQPGWQTQAPAKGIFEIWPTTSANIRIVRAMVRSQQLPPKNNYGVRLTQRRVRQTPAATFSCLGCECDHCDDFGLGADVYEWKMNKGSGECELKKKSCGFWCKIGKGFKAVGKVALVAAPLALAPFTGGASLGLTAASGAAATAAAVATASASTITSIIAQRQGIPQGAQVKDPEGECAVWMQKKQQEETEKARKAAEAAAAAAKAEQDARIANEAKKLAEKESGSGSGLFGQPLLIGALVLGGALLLSRR